MNLDFSVLLQGEYLTLFLQGAAVTFSLFAVSLFFAVTVAFVLTGLRAADFRVVNLLVAAFIEYQRNIPVLVHLLIWYFAVPQILPSYVRIWINDHNSEFIFAATALSLNIAAFMAEDLRSGLRSISSGQTEAARSLGLSLTQTLRYVLMPQAIRVSIPPIISQSLILFKSTSLAMAVGVAELTYVSRELENLTFRTFEAFAIVSALYIVTCYAILVAGELINRRLLAYRT